MLLSPWHRGSADASEACGLAMLVIEVRNRRCVETFYKRQPGPLDWCGQVVRKLWHCSWLYQGDLGWVSLCLSFPEVPYWFWEEKVKAFRDVWNVRCYQMLNGGKMMSQELKSGPCVSKQGWAASLSSGITHHWWCLWHHNTQLDTQ